MIFYSLYHFGSTTTLLNQYVLNFIFKIILNKKMRQLAIQKLTQRMN